MPLELDAVCSVSLFFLLVSVLLHSPPVPSFLLRFSDPLPPPLPPLHYLLHLSPSDCLFFFFLSQASPKRYHMKAVLLHYLQMIKPDEIHCVHDPWAFSICVLDVCSHAHFFILLSGLSCPLRPIKLVERLNTDTWILMAWLCEHHSHLLSI